MNCSYQSRAHKVTTTHWYIFPPASWRKTIISVSILRSKSNITHSLNRIGKFSCHRFCGNASGLFAIVFCFTKITYQNLLVKSNAFDDWTSEHVWFTLSIPLFRFSLTLNIILEWGRFQHLPSRICFPQHFCIVNSTRKSAQTFFEWLKICFMPFWQYKTFSNRKYDVQSTLSHWMNNSGRFGRQKESTSFYDISIFSQYSIY